MDLRDLTHRETRILWIVLAILFFFLYSYLGFFAPRDIYNSPDETANAYFARVFRERGELRSSEPMETVAEGRLHPRSVIVRDGALVPESFHGLPVLYGLVSFFGQNVSPFLTPIIAVLVVLAWRGICARLFGHCAGEFAGLLLMITPAWWYWTSRGLYHNVLFVSLLIFATYFFISRPIQNVIARLRQMTEQKQSREGELTFHGRDRFASLAMTTSIDVVFSGLTLALAIWVRTAESVWVLLLTTTLIFIYRKQIRLSEFAAFVIIFAIALVPMLVINNDLYGHPLRTGYTVGSTLTPPSPLEGEGANRISSPSLEGEEEGVVDQNSIAQSLYRSIAPFGFHPRTALNNFLTYFVTLPWWMTAVLGLSLIWFGFKLLRARLEKNEIVLISIFLAVTGWLALVYGSWVIHDNPDPTAQTIGISYSRYWLPAFVLASGISGYGLSVLRNYREGAMRHLLPPALILVLAIFSVQQVFLTRGDGLRDVAGTLHQYAAIREDALRRIPANAVVIVDRGDKIFFPVRRVMYPLRDDKTFAVLQNLSLRVPLFYYGITMLEDDFAAQNKKLESLGLRLDFEKMYIDNSLYRIVNR